jgi:hypothetical protein
MGTLLDAEDRPIPRGRYEKAIFREMQIENGRWIELSDTRLEPGCSLSLHVPWQVKDICGSSIQFRVIVEAEWFYYETVYPAVLEELEDGTAQKLIKTAMSVAEDQNYILYETMLPHSCDN